MSYQADENTCWPWLLEKWIVLVRQPNPNVKGYRWMVFLNCMVTQKSVQNAKRGQCYTISKALYLMSGLIFLKNISTEVVTHSNISKDFCILYRMNQDRNVDIPTEAIFFFLFFPRDSGTQGIALCFWKT